MSRGPHRSSDPAIRDHQEWLGYLQPNGLVVSPQVLFDQQVIIDRSALADLQRAFTAALAIPAGGDAEPRFGAFLEPQADGRPDGFAIRFLGWHPELIDWNTLERHTLHESATVSIPELGATLSPTAALRYPKPADPARPYQLLVEEVEPDAPFDDRYNATHLWETSRSAKFERLLTETGVALGVLSNSKQIRLFYAPRGETTGHLTFDVAHMTGTAGRLIVGGLHELLKAFRLTNAPTKALLPSLCETSRKYQSTVSAALAEQVLEALYELVRGFQSAHDATHGELLKQHLAGDDDAKQDVYRGLLRTLMRMVFLLFAEDRDLLPAGDLYYRNYSLHGLFERLREDDGRHHDTMDSRYGAWAQLLALFRLMYRGSPHPSLSLPARHGYLFDPDAYPFLEGRTLAAPKPPLVSDGCVYRVLEKLLLLKGEKLSYRTLDVEQIGSVYETMMGFRMTVAEGASIAIKPKKKGGAPIGLDLDRVLAEKPADRAKFIEAAADIGLTPSHKKALKDADTHDALVAALDSRVAHAATPRIVPKRAMLLQPSDERRRSGSHYTPRSLTQPIVAKTLEPILARLGPEARPDQILDLKICDPAMGSGAFLVEVCRQLGKRLEDAWTRHGTAPRVTAQDDLTTLARRMVAQRCVYGVDRNDMAVDLAKLSLWLATLAKDHPFTFLDHALRHGDSLVGLDLAQLEAFHWDASQPKSFVSVKIAEKLQDAITIREEIRRADDSLFREEQLKALLAQSEEATRQLKLAGDLVIAAFFGEEKNTARVERLKECAVLAQEALAGRDPAASERAQRAAAAIIAEHELVPFHWAVAFPEVLLRPNPGFDAIVGNPPFLGGRNLTNAMGSLYSEFLVASIPDCNAAADLCAKFFRCCFARLRGGGVLGLIATNSIAQGDTRDAGLTQICRDGGQIFAATTRYRWPGEVAVIVSIVHIAKGDCVLTPVLDGRRRNRISAYLLGGGPDRQPQRLARNACRSFQGHVVLGMGFTFDDSAPGADDNTPGTPSPLQTLRQIARSGAGVDQFVRPYLGGEEINSSPTHASHRQIIQFGELSENEANAVAPELLAVLKRKVWPERRTKDARKYPRMVNEWWKFWNNRTRLEAALSSRHEAIATSRVNPHCLFARVSASSVFAESVIVFDFASHAALAMLQSSIHEIWARFNSSTALALLRYSSTDAFETFPFPEEFEANDGLERAGQEYFDFRAALMVKNDEGLTKTYNRFHDRNNREPDIVRLRELHAAMDRAVLDAYGWTDIKTDCGFFADYTEEDEDGNEVEKSIRYRWPDEVRDEVLARLLALNAERHAEEVKLGLVSPDGKRLKRTDDDEDADDAESEGDGAPAPKRVKAGRTKSAAATPKSATRKSAKGKQPKTPKARGKAASRSGRLLFGGDD
jgi:hypothetical protein